MQATTILEGEALSVYDLRCSAGPADRPFTEMHARHSLSYVRRGSFGCRTGGREYELVAGALMVGRPNQEYSATHEHHGCGDECLSFKFAPAFVDAFFAPKDIWSVARLPPLPELMVLGELAHAAVEGRASVGVDEAALLLAQKVASVVAGENEKPVKANAGERRRAVEAALWLEANAAEPLGLEDAARQAGLSPYHFLRIFRKALGVTPHQYLLRLRLRRAAKLLVEDGMPVTEVALEAGFADLSNFVRTFGRAAGMSPRRFRRAARSSSRTERKTLQERMAAGV
jgi:AraC family transcriptional regulator